MPHNPFVRWRITGTWAAHMSYSLGGEDYPLPYGTQLPAPASGTLYTSGAPRPFPEFRCGQVGSAGRRSVLILDRPIRDVVAVVFQHQSSFGRPGHYDEGKTIGLSGASANGKDWGGEVHLHIHCLTASGQRRRFTDYFSASASAAPAVSTGGSRPISAPASSANTIQEDDMPTAKEVAEEIFKGLASQEDGSLGKNARDILAAAAADYTLSRLVVASGDGWGKQARDAVGKTASDYLVFALATAEPGSEAALALARIAAAVKQ